MTVSLDKHLQVGLQIADAQTMCELRDLWDRTTGIRMNLPDEERTRLVDMAVGRMLKIAASHEGDGR